MKIYWKNDSLRKKVEKYAYSNSRVQRRMISIERASNFNDIVPVSMGRAHFLKGGSYRGCFAVDLERKGSGKRLICVPCGDCQKDENGNFIKETIREIEIIKIEDYH